MEYKTNLYREMPFCTVHTYATKEEWAAARHTLKGIGGSDAAAVLNKSPWKSAYDLWMEKTGRRPEKQKTNRSIDFGIHAEDHIRALWTLRNADRFEMNYMPHTIMQNNAEKGLLYSPDGLLKEIKTRRLGIWECKTATVNSALQARKWSYDDIPEYYMTQLLHGAYVMPLVSFAILTAFIMRGDDYAEIRDYVVDFADFMDEKEDQRDAVLKFYYRNLIEDHAPRQVLPMI